MSHSRVTHHEKDMNTSKQDIAQADGLCSPAGASTPSMVVTTGNEIAGHTVIDYCGIVRGIAVRVPCLKRGLIGSLRSFLGGNIPEFEAVCEKARRQAYEKMLSQAIKTKADAIIAFRYDTNYYYSVTEVLAYGTAVKIQRV